MLKTTSKAFAREVAAGRAELARKRAAALKRRAHAVAAGGNEIDIDFATINSHYTSLRGFVTFYILEREYGAHSIARIAKAANATPKAVLACARHVVRRVSRLSDVLGYTVEIEGDYIVCKPVARAPQSRGSRKRSAVSTVLAAEHTAAEADDIDLPTDAAEDEDVE
jgi:hypothetical protein